MQYTRIPTGTENARKAEQTLKAPNPPPSNFRAVITVPSGAWTDGNEDGDADAGETIIYSFEIINTGTVSLYDLEVKSETIGGDSIVCPAVPEGGIAPGATIICSATYEVR